MVSGLLKKSGRGLDNSISDRCGSGEAKKLKGAATYGHEADTASVSLASYRQRMVESSLLGLVECSDFKGEGDDPGSGEREGMAKTGDSEVLEPVAGLEFDGEQVETQSVPVRGVSTSFRRQPDTYYGDWKTQYKGKKRLDLPQSILQVIATSLCSDLVVAAILQDSLWVAETVLCVPAGLITVPVRFSKSVMAASRKCEVLNAEQLLLPSLLTSALGARPKCFLATRFQAEGYEGLCYSVWLDPLKVPDVAEAIMSEASQSLPLLLSSSMQALSCDRLERLFDVIMKKIPQAVVFVDDRQGQCLLNPTAAELLGLTGPGEYETNHVAEGMQHLADRSIASEDVGRFLSMLAGSADQDQDWIWELAHPKCALRVRSYASTNGRVCLFDDVTSERNARDAVEVANMSKSQFLAVMSHELRTPMTGVLGMLDLLRLTPLTPEQGRFLSAMEGSAEGLMQVLNEVLDFSKIQSGHLALEEADFNIGKLLEQVNVLFEGRLAEKKLTMIIDAPSKDLFVNGDPNRLRQVLINLVSNAIKFTYEGVISISWKPVPCSSGTLDWGNESDSVVSVLPFEPGIKERYWCKSVIDSTVSSLSEGDGCEQRNRLTKVQDCAHSLDLTGNLCPKQTQVDSRTWYEVRVKDTGIGLSKEQQDRLFKSFSQAESSTSRRFGGTGLGLAICKGLINVMGGKIWVESELGQGSTFAFCVPLHLVADASENTWVTGDCLALHTQRSLSYQKLNSLEISGPSLKVLVAEDNTINQLLIQKMLKHHGHEVELVSNGQSAVEAVQTGQHDMILMDLLMPVLDGLSATKAIRGLQGTASLVPIYALTADVLTIGKISLEAMGLDGYITKPINWHSLSQVIDRVVSIKRVGGWRQVGGIL